MGLTSQLNRKYRSMIARGEYPICYLCGKKITKKNEVSQDHAIAKSRGGLTIEANLAPTHRICNSKKGSMTVAEWFSLRTLERS